MLKRLATWAACCSRIPPACVTVGNESVVFFRSKLIHHFRDQPTWPERKRPQNLVQVLVFERKQRCSVQDAILGRGEAFGHLDGLLLLHPAYFTEPCLQLDVLLPFRNPPLLLGAALLSGFRLGGTQPVLAVAAGKLTKPEKSQESRSRGEEKGTGK